MQAIETKFTRSDYMTKACSHEEYYGQFVTPAIRNAVKARFGDRINKSNDPHFNDIPLAQWDSFHGNPNFASTLNVPSIYRAILPAIKAAGEWLTLVTMTCISKQAARQLKG